MDHITLSIHGEAHPHAQNWVSSWGRKDKKNGVQDTIMFVVYLFSTYIITRTSEAGLFFLFSFSSSDNEGDSEIQCHNQLYRVFIFLY